MRRDREQKETDIARENIMSGIMQYKVVDKLYTSRMEKERNRT